MSGMKLGHIGSETRSPGQILEIVQRERYKCNLHETLPECLYHSNPGQGQNWVNSNIKIGHKVKS